MSQRQQRLLESNVEVVDVDDRAAEDGRLREELRRVTIERDGMRAEIIRLRQRVNQIEAPAAALRTTLDPLYTALRAVMGEIEVIDPPDSPAPVAQAGGGVADSRVAEVWKSWKERLGPMCGKVIDALLLHGEMNTTQLSIAAQIHRTNVPKAIFKMNQAGLINKNGGRFSLKQL
jgi:hypothetical protein